jgi:DNA-binding XRE family transcriptional regulator
MRIVTLPSDRPHPKATLCLKLAELFHAEDLPTHIILDGTDYSSEQTKYQEEFEGPAFLWTKGKSIDNQPEQFIEVTKDPDCEEIYWFSLKALTFSEMMFTWLFFHEFRHGYQIRFEFGQKMSRSELRRISQRLRNTSYMEFFNATDLDVDELDADLFALHQLERVYGKYELCAFVKSSDFIPRGGVQLEAYLRFIRDLVVELHKTPWFESFYEYRPVKSSHAPS